MDKVEFDPALKQRSAYRYWVGEHVRFTDLDALGHVSAVRVNEYFNGARATLFHRAIENWPHSDQLPVMKLAITQNDSEMHFPSEVDIGLVIEKFGNTSVTVAAAVFEGDVCTALTRNVFVFIDAKTRQATRPSDVIKENFLKLAGQPLREEKIRAQI